jgi:hypothetical protein
MIIIRNKVVHLGTIGCKDCKPRYKNVVGTHLGEINWVESPVSHDVFYVEGSALFNCPEHEEYQVLTQKTTTYIENIWKLKDENGGQ